MLKTILFDLDGTIVDTNELIIETFVHTLQTHNLPAVPRDYISANMGRPLLEQLQHFSGLAEVDYMVDTYRDYNIGRHDELVTEFPHVHEVLSALHKHGIQLGIVTSKVRKTTLMGLKLCNLESFISGIVTVEDVNYPKPHAEPVLKALELLQADPATTLMVGDSQFDIQSAQGAGVRSAGVAWSLKGEKFLQQFKPDYMLQDMRDLLTIAGIKRDEG